MPIDCASFFINTKLLFFYISHLRQKKGSEQLNTVLCCDSTFYLPTPDLYMYSQLLPLTLLFFLLFSPYLSLSLIPLHTLVSHDR
jgi:hypothetical protein